MITEKVRFDEQEKQILHDYIVANVVEEPKCYEPNGYEFIFTNDCFPQFRNMTLDVVVVLVSETESISFSYKLMDGNDEVETNLDAVFEDKVLNSIEKQVW